MIRAYTRTALVAGFTLAALGWPACAREKSQATATRTYPYSIVCTTGMVADIVRQIAGEKANVINLIGEGVDPHLYVATRSDVARLLEADIVFYNGLMLEGKMTDALIKVGRSRPVYAVSELVDEKLFRQPPEFAGHYDPHLWMDVSLWRKCTELVARTLGEFDPPNAAFYKTNFDRYAQEMDRLHAYAEQCLKSIPAESRVLVTAHDAFGYMTRPYGLEVRGIQGISTESEAGVADINRLVDLLVERRIRAVFVESSVPGKNVQALIEGAASRGHDVVIGGTLYSDAMGRPGTYEGSYVGMIDHNVTAIARALGGEAPAKGMQGKLQSQ